MTPKPGDWQCLYAQLRAQWGTQHWWPAETVFEVMVGAILTQNTAWTNVEKAIAQLRSAKLLSVQAILDSDDATLEACLRPSGYYRVKGRRLRALCQFLLAEGCAEEPRHLRERAGVAELRKRLLQVHGVGEETADSILLYALGLPIMVVDAYTRRIGSRLGWVDQNVSYASLQASIERNLPAEDASIRNEFHALLVTLGKECCRPKRPRCTQCPLVSHCAYARSAMPR